MKMTLTECYNRLSRRAQPFIPLKADDSSFPLDSLVCSVSSVANKAKLLKLSF